MRAIKNQSPVSGCQFPASVPSSQIDRQLATGHGSLSLSLLVLLVRADHAHHAAAANDLALVTDSLDRRSYLHYRSFPPDLTTRPTASLRFFRASRPAGSAPGEPGRRSARG